jgi:hypothetical protein
MTESSRTADTVLLAVCLIAAAAAYRPPDVGFDQLGRLTLSGARTALTGPLIGGDPPSGPPNVQCPC